jgi:hypothetical protein
MEWPRLHAACPAPRYLLNVGLFFCERSNELKQRMMLWAMSAILKESPQLDL